MNESCLKVDVDGIEILPKKYAPVKWHDTVLDNDERDIIREEAERVLREEEDQFEQDYEEYYSDDDDEEEEDEVDMDEEDGLPSGVLMGYIEILGKYGYADIDKLSRLSPEDWDDLKVNVGIEPEHEKHLLAGLGIKRPKKKIKKYRKRRNDDDDDEEEARGDDEEPSLESELFALALNRTSSLEDAPQSPPQSPRASFDQVESNPSVRSLRDRIAARKKEGSFDETKASSGSLLKKGSDHEIRGSESAGFKERILARKKEAEKDQRGSEHEEHHSVANVIAQRKAHSQELERAQQGSESRSRNNKNSKLEGAGASMDLSAPDPKAILRQRIAARKETSNPLAADDADKPSSRTSSTDESNATPPTQRGRGRTQDQPKTIVVKLDKDGNIKNKKTSPRTRAPTPGRSNWGKSATPKNDPVPASSTIEKKSSFTKPKTSSSRYTSPYRQRATGGSFTKEANASSSSEKSEKREKSPRAKGFGARFMKS